MTPRYILCTDCSIVLCNLCIYLNLYLYLSVLVCIVNIVSNRHVHCYFGNGGRQGTECHTLSPLPGRTWRSRWGPAKCTVQNWIKNKDSPVSMLVFPATNRVWHNIPDAQDKTPKPKNYRNILLALVGSVWQELHCTASQNPKHHLLKAGSRICEWKVPALSTATRLHTLHQYGVWRSEWSVVKIGKSKSGWVR